MIKTLLRWSPTANGAAQGAAAPPDGADVGTLDSALPPSSGAVAGATAGLVHSPPSHAEVAECLAHERFLWLDVEDPTEADFARLQRDFGFHPLAIEDAVRTQQRPKIDEYADYFFMVFYAVAVQPHAEVTTQQISVFLGATYLITAHHGSSPEIAESARRWERNQVDVGRSIGAVLYSVLDSLVDHYFPVIDQLVDRIEALEEEILSQTNRRTLAHLFAMKRDLLRLRRVLGPERDVLNVLIRRDSPVVDPQTGLYLQDVYDHVIRVIDTVDLYRDLLSGALDAYLSVTSNNLNQV
ncbi:MAG: magnesium transporter CorA family protein, partial [Dehalococcoidia bacterium]